jgi:hypothetical protein
MERADMGADAVGGIGRAAGRRVLGNARDQLGLDAGLQRPSLLERRPALPQAAVIDAGKDRARELQRLVLRRQGQCDLPAGELVAGGGVEIVDRELDLVGIGLGEAGCRRDDVHRLPRAPPLGDPFGKCGDFPGVHGHSS